MKKAILIVTIALAVATIALSVAQIFLGIGFPGVQQLLFAALFGLFALNHFQHQRNRDLAFWLWIAAATLSFVAALVIIQPFF